MKMLDLYSMPESISEHTRLFHRLSDTNPVTYIEKEEVIYFHDTLIEYYGGLPGVRDENLILPSRLLTMAEDDNRAFATYGLYEIAVQYLIHYAGKHPFTDGNKRTGAAVALEFLSQNGYPWKGDEILLEALTRRIADNPKIADFFAVELFIKATRIGSVTPRLKL